MMKEGPTLVVIPEQRVWNCFSCKYYSYKMIHSGFDPKYESLCLKLNQQGQLIADGESGTAYPLMLNYFTIGDRTPKECPFLQSMERDNKIEDLGIN